LDHSCQDPLFLCQKAKTPNQYFLIFQYIISLYIEVLTGECA
jgi:hypothetical protein